MGTPVGHRTRLSPATAIGVALLAAGLVLAGTARAQSQPEQLLRQILPGITGQQDPQALRDAGERACERYAEDRGLDVRRVLEARRSGEEDLEVTLDVEDRDDRYDAVCLYDSRDQDVREFERARGSASRGGDEEVDEALERRARDACQDAAEDRDLDEVDVDEVRARDRGTVEVAIVARDRGERREVTCLYDAEERRAFLAAK